MIDEVIIGEIRTYILSNIDVKECDVEHHVYLDSYAGPLRSNGYRPSGTPLDGLEAIEVNGFIYSCTSQNVSTDQGI